MVGSGYLQPLKPQPTILLWDTEVQLSLQRGCEGNVEGRGVFSLS